MPTPTDSITRIPLGLKTGMNGWVNFNVLNMEQIPAGMHIYFEDGLTHVNQDLKITPQYRYFLKAGVYNNRFSLVFSLKDLLTSSTALASEKFTITRPGGVLSVNLNLTVDEKGILQLVNMGGQVLYRKEVFGNESIELNTHLNSGVYIISLISGNKIYSKKVIIQKE
jgi:hypothetical protein